MTDDEFEKMLRTVRPWYGRLAAWIYDHLFPSMITFALVVVAIFEIVYKVIREYVIWTR